MSLRPSIQDLVDLLEQNRVKTDQLITMRNDALRQLSELTAERTELTAQLEKQRARLKKRGWSN